MSERGDASKSDSARCDDHPMGKPQPVDAVSGCRSHAGGRPRVVRSTLRRQRLAGNDLLDARLLEVPREAKCLKCPDPDPVEIDLVPREAVSRAGGMRVMIVVPALSERQQRDPPVVRRIVMRLKP